MLQMRKFLSLVCLLVSYVRAFRPPPCSSTVLAATSNTVSSHLRRTSTRVFGVNPKLLKRFLKKKVVDLDDEEDEDSDAQLKALEEAASANKHEFEALLKAKLDEWKELKAAGLLDKLATEELNDEIIEEVDDVSKRLLRRRRGEKKEGGSSSDTDEQDDSELSPADFKAKTLFDLREKLVIVGSAKTGSSLGCFSLLNEMKDKEVFNVELAESLLLSMTRLDSAQLAVSAIKTYLKWIKDGLIEPSTPKFPILFANSCFSSGAKGLAEAGSKTKGVLIAEGSAEEDDFLPGEVCAAIYSIEGTYSSDATNTSSSDKSGKKLTKKGPPAASAVVGVKSIVIDTASPEYQQTLALLSELKQKMKRYSVPELNPVIRALGRKRITNEIFAYFDSMRAAGHKPDDESFEFLTNALVVSVGEESKAKAMKDLPTSDPKMPEVVFTGRSNVGKSSLVNFLVNRKALASTSPTPGHTTQFHFFAVNKDRTDLPSFYLVDVPGLGYAEAEENTQDSWRGLLERYLSVRDHLSAVFHLIDSRHKVTATDQLMMEIASRAAVTRKAEGKEPFIYSVVLTKTDKASDKVLRQTEKDVREYTKELTQTLRISSVPDEPTEIDLAAVTAVTSSIPILKTSSLERVGRDDVWRLLQDVLTRRNR